MSGWVGKKPNQLKLHLSADADFACCPDSQRTAEIYSAIREPAICFSTAGASKRQTCVSDSTPDAEITAADFALRTARLPCLQLWETLFERMVGLDFHEDNQAMIRACQTGRNPTMRHIGRTHRVSVAWMHKRFTTRGINLVYESTHRQCADIYTKGFTEPLKWYAVCLLVNVVDGHKLAQLLTSFTIHNYEKEQEEILALFPDTERKKATPHDLYEYTAAPSVKRRGGCHEECRYYRDARHSQRSQPRFRRVVLPRSTSKKDRMGRRFGFRLYPGRRTTKVAGEPARPSTRIFSTAACPEHAYSIQRPSHKYK